MRSRRELSHEGLETIQAFFAQPHLQHLGLELAVCWILERLLEMDSYPTALMQELAHRHPQLRLSETVLQQALTLLAQEGAISSYSQRCPSRGRPRRMLHLQEDHRRYAESLMTDWRRWLQENGGAKRMAPTDAAAPGFHPAAHAAVGGRTGVLSQGSQ